MTNIRKYVVSTTLKSASAWRNSTLIRDSIVEAVRQLKHLPGKNILVDGSSVLTQVLAQNDLVDEYSLLPDFEFDGTHPKWRREVTSRHLNCNPEPTKFLPPAYFLISHSSFY